MPISIMNPSQNSINFIGILLFCILSSCAPILDGPMARNYLGNYNHPTGDYPDLPNTLNTLDDQGQSTEKGQLKLHVSVPYLNHFRFSPQNEGVQVSSGFLGFSIGLDYYPKSKNFVSLSASAVMDHPVPFPVGIDYASGTSRIMSATYLSLTNNHTAHRLSLGYGLVFGKNNWRLTNFDSAPEISVVTKYNWALGTIGTAYYQVAKSFNLGLIYRTSLYRFNASSSWYYEHQVSLDIAWKIKL
jgi:hypothetical protein